MQAVSAGTRWMLRLDEGQDLHSALGDFAKTNNIRAASVLMGIGMLKSGTLGYWNGAEYQPRDIKEPHELLALEGSIAEADGVPSVHLHATTADREHRSIGGHLLRGTVGVLAEIYLETFPGRVFGRPLNESFGLRMLDLEPGPSS